MGSGLGSGLGGEEWAAEEEDAGREGRGRPSQPGFNPFVYRAARVSAFLRSAPAHPHTDVKKVRVWVGTYAPARIVEALL
jgi:hypothetical protein